MKLALATSIVLSCIAFLPGESGAEPQQKETVLSHIPRGPVESSALDEIGYSHRRQILEIKFKSGTIYRYVGVPKSVYHDMLKAQSKTAFYNWNIRGYYRSYHVYPRVKDEQKKH